MQPKAGGSGLTQFCQVLQEAGLVAVVASYLTQVVKSLRVDFRVRAVQCFQDLLGFLVLAGAAQRHGQRQLEFWTIVRTYHAEQVPILVRGVAESPALGQEIGARSVSLQPQGRQLGGRRQLFQFDISLAGLRTQRHGDVQVAQDLSRLNRLPAGGVGLSQGQLQIGLRWLPILLQYGNRLLRPVVCQQRVAIQNPRIAQQQRVRILLLECAQSADSFRRPPALEIGSAQIKADVIAQISSQGFGAIEWIDGFGVVLIENVRISQHQPGQRARIFLGVTPRVGLYSRVSGGRAVLQQLPRHWLQTRGGDEGRVHAARAGRWMAAVPNRGLALPFPRMLGFRGRGLCRGRQSEERRIGAQDGRDQRNSNQDR